MADILGKLKQMWNTPDDEYDYDDKHDDTEDKKVKTVTEEYYPEEIMPVPETEPIPMPISEPIPDFTPPVFNDPIPTPVPPINRNPVMNIDATTKLQVVMFRPDRFSDETRTIADELISNHTIVLNLENANKDNSRRIIDFMSGAAYATGGKIKRVATSTFLVIPGSVHMSGEDLLAQLESNGIVI